LEIGDRPDAREHAMPVTAKLSRKFYDTLGEEITNELVDWFNSVDATYRTDLRELNELNFARFDAKLEQRVAQLDAKLEQRMAELRAELTVGLAALKGELTAEIARSQAATVKWMFGFWAPTALAIVGTALGVLALLLRS
jgi:hypothetical protein